MTGKQLNILRRFNRITQKDLANLFGFSTPKIVQVLESEEFIPDKFAIILAEQCQFEARKRFR
jgi:transcriptional regulator with XRE-family HTH domain